MKTFVNIISKTVTVLGYISLSSGIVLSGVYYKFHNIYIETTLWILFFIGIILFHLSQDLRDFDKDSDAKDIAFEKY